jgi:hypothetical protein
MRIMSIMRVSFPVPTARIERVARLT